MFFLNKEYSVDVNGKVNTSKEITINTITAGALMS